ncbi:hypothetical protein [Rhizobium sp. NFR03]|uniref:DUF6894 family protein n=1 Tax=Rhizobium sp. NFR03 TaxID=1566263 RepID=UPI0008CD4967|nr:hypothetical protein [Rhizobium sp. NFR03]SES42678.1 hypothetical protein SAMN03159406_04303 [Rhizobium sp. NFR03]
MTRYFFNIRRRTSLCIDEEGQEFASFAEAYMGAISSLCEIAGDSLKTADPVEVYAIEVTDTAGAVLHSVTMTEAVLPLLPEKQAAIV